MSFVALATCRNIPEPDLDEPLLLAALERARVPAKVLAWDDEAVDWNEPRLTVIRSTWNYYLRPDAFRAWVTERGARLVNAPEIIHWNHHKRYLADLAARGVPVVPTLWIPKEGSPGDQLTCTGWTDIVVKPAVSAGSYRTRRLTGPPFDEAVLAASFALADTMVQPYIASVDAYGERSLIYIDGAITHAIRKSPRFAGQSEQVWGEAVAIADDEREAASRTLACVTGSPLYARIDLVRDAEGRPLLGELELIEPSLFLVHNPAAADRFAAAIARRFDEAGAGPATFGR